MLAEYCVVLSYYRILCSIIMADLELAAYNLTKYPTPGKCPNCHQSIVTNVIYEVGTLTWVFAVGGFIVGFYCCLCFAPFFIDGLKDVVHTCPKCNHIIGTYKRL